LIKPQSKALIKTMSKHQKIAYFSMEIGLSAKIPTYSGGLGVLAGDTLKAAADIHFPMVGVTLLTTHGYFFQNIKDGQQFEEPFSWSIDDFLKPTDAKIKVRIAGEDVTVGAWHYNIIGVHGYEVPVLFLTTDLPENSEKARKYTEFLYGGGPEYRLSQESVLGVGGIRILKEMGFDEVQRYHMNEGHSAFITLELQRELVEVEKVREKCVFTTHTPIPAGHDKFAIDTVKGILDEELFNLLPKETIESGELNMTGLALDHSNYVNGVAQQHAQVSKSMFPNYPIHSITNGVHPKLGFHRILPSFMTSI
jgi:glycogen phosphorylase